MTNVIEHWHSPTGDVLYWSYLDFKPVNQLIGHMDTFLLTIWQDFPFHFTRWDVTDLDKLYVRKRRQTKDVKVKSKPDFVYS